jgi:iron(III) transport system ATP-binding protein
MKEALRMRGVTKRFGEVTAADGLSISVEKGTILSLLGSSGCGKTTALRLIAGFETPDEGVIEIGGRTVYGPGICVPPEKRRAGMVFQDYALFPHLSVSGNTAFGLDKGPRRSGRVREMLSLAGLDGLGSRMPHELSGGQQQRLALARAIAPGPGVLLLDEPFSNLDARLRVQIREEVRDILKRSGTAAVFVTHDRDEAFYMGDLVSVMDRGRLEQTDTPYDIYHSPDSRFVAEFMGTADFIPCKLTDTLAVTVIGSLPAGCMNPGSKDGLEILVRPDDIVLTPSVSGQGVIASGIFQGSSYLYRILLDSGETVHSLASHSRVLGTGTRVLVGFDPHYAPVFFRNGSRVR